jgi:Protein of unknown function DUF104
MGDCVSYTKDRRRGLLKMTTAIEALFDGDVFRPDEPPQLPPNTRVRLIVESPPECSSGEERHDSLNRMARIEFEAGTYDHVILPDGAEGE